MCLYTFFICLVSMFLQMLVVHMTIGKNMTALNSKHVLKCYYACIDLTSCVWFIIYEIINYLHIYIVSMCVRISTRVFDLYESGGTACLHQCVCVCVYVRHSGHLAHTQRHCHARSQVRHSMDGFREVWSQYSPILPCTACYRQPGLTAHSICERHLLPNTHPHKQNI